MSRARSILFVCTGNTCRSAMAASLTSARMSGVDVSSAGTEARDGEPANRRAIDEMDRRGGRAADFIACHRSRCLAAEMAAGADVVVCMEQHHADEVGQIPGCDVRVWDVRDPINGTPAVYRACADSLGRQDRRPRQGARGPGLTEVSAEHRLDLLSDPCEVPRPSRR